MNEQVNDLVDVLTMEAWEALRASATAEQLAMVDGNFCFRELVEIGMHYGIAIAYKHAMELS